MFVVLDLETTGLSVKDDAIIELALLKIDRHTFREVDRFTTLVFPGKEISDLISQITWIQNKDVVWAPTFSQVKAQVQEFIEGFPIIGHNISFDLRFLEAHGIDISKNPSIDTFFLANFLCYDIKSLNLWYLCEYFSIDLENAHRALADTLATAQVFQKLIEKLQKLSEGELDFVRYYFWICQDTWVRLLRDTYLPKKEALSQEKLFEIYMHILGKNIQDITDISHSKNQLDVGVILANIPWFEPRESQKIMLDKVDKTLNHGEKCMIEAPTWIGKTFAYLLPALKYSLSTGEPVHISTSTKALQDQIYFNDLAFLKQHFPEDFSYTKLKGKRNYLSILALSEFLESNSHSPAAMVSFLLKVFFWSMKTEFWELDDLDFYGEEWGFVSQIHAGSVAVFDESNPYSSLEFVQRARKRAKKSNIIITNNHILFQDIISEGSLLWGVKNLILDEAHALEDVVTQSLKKSLWFASFQTLTQKIDQKIQKYKIVLETFALQKQQMLYDMAELFSIFEGALFENFSLDAKYKTLLLQESFFSEREELGMLAKKIFDLAEGLKKWLQDCDEEVALKFQSEIQEISFCQQVIAEVFFHRDFQKSFYYIAHDENKGTQLFSSVLHPGSFLQEYLWSKLESVVITSATLQMGDDFAYIRKMLHLEDFETLTLPSDFDYEKQALLYIPQDLGSVKNNVSQILTFLDVFFRTVRGRTLVLFTAFFMIREVFSQLKSSLESENIHLHAQSISGSKHKQIDAFKKHPENSILLGTDTFWEGIDIPGEDLQYLIIHKIPFQVPTDPVFQARSRLFQDSFQEYAIPKSILKLKQGFWRLIRTKKDTWIVVFLDDRIRNTPWGQKYYQAFPENIKIRTGTTQKLLEILSKHQ